MSHGISRCRKRYNFFFSFDRCRTADWKRSCCVAVSAARVHPDRIVSRRRSRGGIRQQWQSASEQWGSQRNRSEQGPKRGHSRGTKGNGHSEIQVRFLHFPSTFFIFPLDWTNFLLCFFRLVVESRAFYRVFGKWTWKSKNLFLFSTCLHFGFRYRICLDGSIKSIEKF